MKRSEHVPRLPGAQITVSEAAALARVSRKTILQWRKAGFFKWSRPRPAGSSKVLIDGESFFAFVFGGEARP